MTVSPFHASGGSLRPDDPTYVERQADQDFYTALKQGEYCYVLNSRQMGKSSLRSRTQQRLQQEGIACATLDLSGGIDTDITSESWCYTLMDLLMRELKLQPEPSLAAWWDAQAPLSPHGRLERFFRDVLLAQITCPVVIFMDEIDTVLSLEGINRDDFFALIRACYNRRSDDPVYQRLTFALLGVATPTDLIQDPERTPFNIGRSIQLTGFSVTEAQPLVAGLAESVANPQAMLAEILHWTGGQPFLTQKLCNLVVQHTSRTPEPPKPPLLRGVWGGSSFGEIVQQQLIENWESKDEPEHLRTIQTRILAGEKRATRSLALYQQILDGEAVAATGSATQVDLRLTGLVVERQGQLQVYNPIYAQVFNSNWVTAAFAQVRPYAEAIQAWEKAEHQDDAYLLQGEPLTHALAWAEERTLSRSDYQFLVESQKLDLRQALEQATFELDELTNELVKKTQDLEQAEANLSQVNRSLTEARQELVEKTQTLEQAEAELSQVNNRLTTAQTDLHRVRRNTRRRSWAGAVGLTIALLGLGISVLETNKQRALAADFEAQAATAVAETEEALEQNQALTGTNTDLKDSNADLTADLTNLTEKTTELETQTTELETQYQQVSQEVAASRTAQQEAETASRNAQTRYISALRDLTMAEAA
ncbi:MAG: hypothetical protein F6K42_19715 [Leptolyngbya sp. SIO1D8]|nr:hypothetical protein [Leptolyngbya sp. SIO1D8]